MKLSFKKEPRETGLASCARPDPDTVIKADGKRCGEITAPSRFGKDQDRWSVGLMVKQEVTVENPCPFAWVFFKARFDTEPEARVWI